MPVKFMTAGDNTLRAIPDSFVVTVPLRSTSVDTHVFIADGPCELIAVREVHSAAGAASSTLDVMKCDGATVDAPASGTTMLSSTFALDSTINIPITKDASSGLTDTVANRKLIAGEAVSVDLTGTISSLVGVVTLVFKRLQTAGGDY